MEVTFKCPHPDCGKESVLEVDPSPGKIDNYSITCPHCGKPSMKKLPGEIIAGPSAVFPETKKKD